MRYELTNKYGCKRVVFAKNRYHLLKQIKRGDYKYIVATKCIEHLPMKKWLITYEKWVDSDLKTFTIEISARTRSEASEWYHDSWLDYLNAYSNVAKSIEEIKK